VPVEGAVQSVQLDAEFAERGVASNSLSSPREGGANDREFADDIHEMVEFADIDPYRLAHRTKR
jgi:hypothetical protein